MNLRLLAFTDRGFSLARQLAAGLEGEAARCGPSAGLAEWTAQAFAQARALIFVGAAGIAVRAIAPHIRHKTSDPAVVAVDEAGQFAIPLLSGHFGGANDLARRVAELTGGIPVITTATDVRGLFAVDEWAREQNCAILNPERIKSVSGALLAGRTVELCSCWPVAGPPPERVTLSLAGGGADTLNLVPRIVTLGVGCRRGTTREALEAAFLSLLKRTGVCGQAVCSVCTIDLKRDEPGLLAFCARRGLPLTVFSARELAAVEGEFFSSAFVLETTGVDNVCQRAAVLGSGGALLGERFAENGVTMALAAKPFAPDWRWKHA